jgi:uncharacterized protein (DUF952 family)
MALIFHITTNAQWKASQNSAEYRTEALKEEGFIHCCEESQVAGVRSRYYSNQKELVRLTIDTQKLTSALIYDWSPSLEDTFPHIYGPINVDAVVAVHPL